MSNINPYGSPAGVPGQMNSGRAKPQMPTPLVIISIFAIIAGTLGVLGVLCGGFGLVMQAAMDGMNQQNQNLDPAVAKQLDNLQSQQFVPNVIFIALNSLIAPTLIIGAIGCLTRKSWGRVLLMGACSVAIFFVISRSAVGIYYQLATKDLMLKQLTAQDANAAGLFEGAFFAGMLIGITVALFYCSLYGATVFYLSTETVKKFFLANQTGQGSIQSGIRKPL